MIIIRLPRRKWGKAWRAMIEIAPVRLIASDPIYEVTPEHLELLDSRGFAYELVLTRSAKAGKRTKRLGVEPSLGREKQSGRLNL